MHMDLLCVTVPQSNLRSFQAGGSLITHIVLRYRRRAVIFILRFNRVVVNEYDEDIVNFPRKTRERQESSTYASKLFNINF